MKNKIKSFLLISIFFFFFQDIVLASFYSYPKKSLNSNSKNFPKGDIFNEKFNSQYSFNEIKEKKIVSDDFFNQDFPKHLRKFIEYLVVNIEDNSSLNQKKVGIEIKANNQKFIGSKFTAEGNVVIRSKNAVLKTNSFSFDQDSKIMIIEGNVNFRTGNSFLEASNIEYDFLKNKGFILNAYGSADFKDLSKIVINQEDNSKKELIENADINNIKKIRKVKFNNTSNIKLGNIIREYEEEKSFAKNLVDQDLEVKLNPIVITRFFADRIDIENDIWFSKSLSLTNDPFNDPQLIIKNNNYKTIFNEDNTKIRTKWSRLVLDNKLTIPLGPRRIDIDKNQNFKWGNGYDKDKYDGFYIFRGFNRIKKGDNTEIFITKYFPIQRIIKGETKSFPKNEDLVIGPKVKQNANFNDYLGLNTFVKSEKDNWKYIFDFSTNSLDFDKLDKAIDIETFLTINLEDSKKDQEEKEKEVYKDDKEIKFKDNYEISKDLTFFGSYRDKTKNGSLGDIIVKSAYGSRYDIFRKKEKNNIKSVSEKSFSFGNYESSSKLNPDELLNENRINLSYKKGYEFSLWKPKVEEYINKEYKYSPIVIPKGLSWNLEGNLEFFRYGDGSKQDMFSIKTGPKIILGDFKDNFLDYTEISILPRFKFNRGESPFNFDQIIDNKVVELKISQQLYGPLVLNFSGEYSLDKAESNGDQFINPVLEISYERRAYNINIFYNLDSEVGGINFQIHTFNFEGLGDKFK